MKYSEPWITHVKYYREGRNDWMVYVYSNGVWKDKWGFGVFSVEKDENLKETVDVTKLQSVKVWPGRFSDGSVRYDYVELLDTQGNTLLFRGNKDDAVEGMEPQVYELIQGQKWIGDIFTVAEDFHCKDWTPLFMEY